MWAIILTSALAQTPNDGRLVAVVPVIHADVVTSELAGRLEKLVRTELTTAGIPLSREGRVPGQDPAACETNKACFALIGRALGAFAVVRVEGAVVGSEVAVLVQALESTSAQQIGEASFVIALTDVDREVPLRVAPLVKKLNGMLPAPVAVADAKQHPAPTLVPGPGEPAKPELIASPAAPGRSMAPVWITGAGAVVFAGVSAGLLAMGVSARDCLNGAPVMGVPTVCVAQSDATRVAQRADIGATTGGAAAGIAVGLAVTTLIEYLILKD